MTSDVSYFTQDYWMNSLAIGHPLVYHSQANSQNTIGQAPAKDDNYVSIQIFNHVTYFIKQPFLYRLCNGILWTWLNTRQTCKYMSFNANFIFY